MTCPMRRARSNRTLAAAALAALTLFLGSCGGPRLAEGEPRHVILISIDTARADHFGFMGASEAATPRLDAVASQSVVFTDYMTVVPTTLASHVTLMTGKYPFHHGTPRNGFMVNRENDMLAEILKRAGFRTAGFAGSFALDKRFDFAQGFDHYDEDFSLLVGERGVDQNQRSAADVTDAVIRYVSDEGVPDRLFLFAHYFDPHQPYMAPPPFDTLHDPRGRAGLVPVSELLRAAETSPAYAAEEARRHEQQYASEISYVDEEVGRLLEALDERGVLDDALLVVTSDHGESMWEHGEEFDHGEKVYQSTMHALCMFRLPGGRGGGVRSDWPIASTDVLPTVLSALGIDAPAGVDGEAVPLGAPVGPTPERPRFGQATKPWRGVETDPRWTNMLKARCVRAGRYKYVQTPYLGTEELYDLENDPDEGSDLLVTGSGQEAALAAEFRPMLERWAASADPLPSRFEPSQQEETTERLRSLGYLR